jgi:hypothetical protein
MSESAHKLTRLLYQLCSNRSLASFSAQLAKARNRVVAAQLLRRQYHAGLTPSVDEPAPPPASISRDTRLVKPAHKWTLDLIVDLRQRRVTSLLSSCGLAQQKEQMLLQEQGYAHLFWCLLNYLEDSLGVPVEENGRHWPLTTLCVHPSIAVGQTGCARASAAAKVTVNAFGHVPTHAFVRVDAGGGVVWFGQPILCATVSTVGGAKHEIVYCKWLDFALTGTERLKLPLPTTFPLHQWEKTYMGLPPPGGRAHQASVSFGVVDASKGARCARAPPHDVLRTTYQHTICCACVRRAAVLNWEPIVSIGIRGWRPTSAYVSRPPAAGARKRSRREREEAPPSGVGEPLFANNVHAWSF